jgi:predicted sulfurtransferase
LNTRQIKEEGLQSKFIGKNFVFDHRLGKELLTILCRNAINAETM